MCSLRSRQRCGGSRRWWRAGRRRTRCSPRFSRRSGGCFPSITCTWGATNPTIRTPSSHPGASHALLCPGPRLGGRTSARSCSRPVARPGSRAMPMPPGRSVSPPARRASARRSGRRSLSRAPLGGHGCRLARGAGPSCRRRGATGVFHGAFGGDDRECESRAGVTRLAADQAALRRVATLVARAVPPEEVFAAVVEEVGRLLRRRLRGPGPLRARRDDHLRRRLGRDRAASRSAPG